MFSGNLRIMNTDDDMARVEWIEKCGLENLRSHLAAMDHLNKESNTTLTLLLAGAGAALANAIRGFDTISSPSPTTVTSLALSLYLFLVSGFLVWKCIWIGEAQQPTNEPANLDHPDYSFLVVRRTELKGIQSRIKLAIARNESTANWLNGLRVATIVGTPIVGSLLFLYLQMAHLFA